MVMIATIMMMSVMMTLLQYVDAHKRTCPPPGLWLALARDPILERFLQTNFLQDHHNDDDYDDHDDGWPENQFQREKNCSAIFFEVDLHYCHHD